MLFAAASQEPSLPCIALACSLLNPADEVLLLLQLSGCGLAICLYFRESKQDLPQGHQQFGADFRCWMHLAMANTNPRTKTKAPPTARVINVVLIAPDTASTVVDDTGATVLKKTMVWYLHLRAKIAQRMMPGIKRHSERTGGQGTAASHFHTPLQRGNMRFN